MAKRYQYTNAKVHISHHQKDKIRKALNDKKPVTIQLKYEDLNGDDILAFTQGQLNNMAKAYENSTGVRIIMSKTQVEHNKTIEGGFLGALLGAVASAVLPSAVSWIYNKIAGNNAPKGASSTEPQANEFTSGKGLYIKRGGQIVNIRQLGSGLYLKPYTSDKMATYGDGLFIKTGGRFESVPNVNLKDLELLNIL